MKISGFDVYAVYDPGRVSIVTFRRIGGFAFRSMRALRSEEQRQREERQRVQQHFVQYQPHSYHPQPLRQHRPLPPDEPTGGFGCMSLAVLGGLVAAAMAVLFRSQARCKQ